MGTDLRKNVPSTSCKPWKDHPNRSRCPTSNPNMLEKSESRNVVCAVLTWA